MKTYWAMIAAAVLSLAPAVWAQNTVQLQPGVARVSLVHGDVNMQRGDSGDWVAVTLNTPIVAGDRVSTGERSRAEVQLDFANILRLDQNSTAKIADLTRTHTQVQMGQGLANYDVLKGSEADAEVDTPNVAVRPLKEGSYRIEVNSDSETRVIVRKGAAEITTPQGSTRVESGDMITIQGVDSPQYQTASAPGKDDWDHFNSDRDHLIRDADSWQHANRYYTGSQDLDAYGRWEEIPDYGSVWLPAAGPDWAPYHDGRWVWEPYYGWTWVSYEPWGWAPYHYGRWFLYAGSWAWWPGPVYGGFRPLWAPAYVSFFGFGEHFGVGVGFGFGHIGWLPCGPGDGFFPWYGRGRNVVNVTNVTNITNITNITNVRNVNGAPVAPLFRGRGISNVVAARNNPRLLRGISTMPTETFGKGAVPARGQPIDVATFRKGGLLTGQVPVVPTRESLRPVDRQVFAPHNATNLENQHFFSKGQTPAFTPRPFSEQQAQVAKVVNGASANRTAETAQTGTRENSKSSGVNVSQTAGARSTDERGNVSARGGASANERLGGGEKSPSASETNIGVGRSNSSAGATAGAGKTAQNDSGARAGWHRFGDSNQAASAGSSATRGSNAPSRTEGSQRGSDSTSGSPSRSNNNPNNQPAARDSGAGSRSADSTSSRGAGWHSFSRSSDTSSGSGATGRGSNASRDTGAGRDTTNSNQRRSTGDANSNSNGGSSSESPRTSSRGEPQSSSQSAGSGGWRTFSRSSEASQPESRSSAGAEGRGSNASPSRRESSPSSGAEPRGSSSYGGRSSGGYGRSESSGGYGRPPLDLRQPIVGPRTAGGYGSRASESRGGSRGESSHSQSSGHSSSGSSPHSSRSRSR